LRGHILPRGTGYVTELGMTGRLGFTGGGFDPAYFAADLRGEDLSVLPPFELASGEMTVGAVLITTDDQHRVTHIARLQFGEDHPRHLPVNHVRSENSR
jgi:calcineurin-like phosphoesterase